jgi:hypothetical protein
MKRLLSTSSLAAVLALGVSAHAAPVVIDEFSTTQSVTIGSNADGQDSVTGAAILGGSREATISNINPQDQDFETIFVAQDGVARFESGAGGTGAGIRSQFVLEYDGTADGSFDPSGLGGIDLIDGTNTVIAFDLPFVSGSSTLTFEVFDNDGSASVDFIADTAGIFSIAFADFIGIDFTQVSAFRLTALNDTAAADFNLNRILAVPTADVIIPVPGAALLFAGAIGGYAASRRRKRA